MKNFGRTEKSASRFDEKENKIKSSLEDLEVQDKQLHEISYKQFDEISDNQFHEISAKENKVKSSPEDFEVQDK